MCDQSFNILIKNLFLQISKPFEFLENIVKVNIIQIKSKLLYPLAE